MGIISNCARPSALVMHYECVARTYAYRGIISYFAQYTCIVKCNACKETYLRSRYIGDLLWYIGDLLITYYAYLNASNLHYEGVVFMYAYVCIISYFAYHACIIRCKKIFFKQSFRCLYS